MHRWRIELESTAGVPRLLDDVLRSLDLSIVDEGGKRCLVGQRLEACTDADAVRREASKVARSIAVACEHQPSITLRLNLSSTVVEATPSGDRQHRYLRPIVGTIAVTLGGASCIATGTVGTATPEDAERIAEQAYQKELRAISVRVRSAFLSEVDAVKVQRLLTWELTPHVMGVISDLIEEGKGNQARFRFAPQPEWLRFDKSICDPDVMGDMARHGNRKRGPPYTPMSLAEAQAFIRATAERWLEYVAGMRDLRAASKL
jgi:hypothetical protein